MFLTFMCGCDLRLTTIIKPTWWWWSDSSRDCSAVQPESKAR